MRVQSSPLDSRSTTPHSHIATRSSPVRAAYKGLVAQRGDGDCGPCSRGWRVSTDPPGAPEELAAAVGAPAAHLIGAGGAEGAFVTADASVGFRRQGATAALAGRTHLKHGYLLR